MFRLIKSTSCSHAMAKAGLPAVLAALIQYQLTTPSECTWSRRPDFRPLSNLAVSLGSNPSQWNPRLHQRLVKAMPVMTMTGPSMSRCLGLIREASAGY